MLTKKFRAWKNNRLIPNAIPYDDNHIVAGTKILNGQHFLKLDEVDFIEQQTSIKVYNHKENLYEGDIVSYIKNKSIYAGIIGFYQIKYHNELIYCESYSNGIKLGTIKMFSETQKIEENIEKPLYLGNIHIDEFQTTNLIPKLKSILRELYDR